MFFLSNVIYFTFVDKLFEITFIDHSADNNTALLKMYANAQQYYCKIKSYYKNICTASYSCCHVFKKFTVYSL